RHNQVYVNSKRVNIPSFTVDKNDVITVKVKAKGLEKIRENLEISKDRTLAAWLSFDKEALQASILRLPEKEDLQQLIQEQLIVELYSK
ncbi:MAG: S4 domain-containing protein, partial [Candidatus Omnitrophota bacterium]